jgi:hypothetical protein
MLLLPGRELQRANAESHGISRMQRSELGEYQLDEAACRPKANTVVRGL